MANKKISQLPIGVLSGNTIFPIVSAGVTSQSDLATIGGFINTNFISGGTIFSGGTVTGPTTFLGGLTSNTITVETISATTYLNLPVDSSSTAATYVLGWQTERQLGSSITIGLGKGKLLLTNGSNMITGVDGVDFTDQSTFDSPFYYYEATVILPDGTRRYISLNSNTGSTIADIYDIYSDNQYDNALGAAWTAGTGEYEYFSYFISEANGELSNSEGYATNANGIAAHAEGQNTFANGTNAHAEGGGSRATGNYSHAEGSSTVAAGYSSHAEGGSTLANSFFDHAEGNNSIASGTSSHAEGQQTRAGGPHSHAEGYNTKANGQGSHAEGDTTQATGTYSHTEGRLTIASNNGSHAEGLNTQASGEASHAEGNDTHAIGENAHSEGNQTNANGSYSHAEGINTFANGNFGSHAEGFATQATSDSSHAEGAQTLATGPWSHAEGNNTLASGQFSHAEGNFTQATSDGSHAGGIQSIASGLYSFVHGSGSTATNTNTIVLGMGISGTTANTTYVDNLNIKTVPSGTSINNLGIDSNGHVVIGSSGSSISPLQVNNTNKTAWNNGAGDISTNTSFGDNALAANTTGYENTAFGSGALALMQTGFFNVAVGLDALTSDRFGRDNTAVGDDALFSNTGSAGSAIEGSQSTAIGSGAMTLNTVGNGTAVGSYALFSQTTGLWNIAIGQQAGGGITSGSNNVIVASAGAAAIGLGISTGSNNMILAPNLGNAPSITTGSGNIVLGKATGLAAAATNTITLADGVGNIRMTIDSTGATKFYGSVSASTLTGVKYTSGTGAINNSPNGFVHGNNSTAGTGSSIVILGSNINGLSANTTYVDNLNIKTLPVTGGVLGLAVNSAGQVVTNGVALLLDDVLTALTFNQTTGILTTYNASGGTHDLDGFNFTGGTVVGETIVTGGLSAVTISAVTYYNLPLDIYVTGGTFDSNTGVITYINNTGGTFTVSGFSGNTDIYTTGFTFNPANYNLSITRNDGVTLTQNLAILASDMTITGGTYDIYTGIVTFTNNTGGTFNVTGFTSGMTDSYTTGATLVGNTIQFGSNVYGPNFYNVNLLPVLSSKTDTALFSSHTANTNNPHQTSFANLTSTAHTHSISDVINLQSSLNQKFDKTGGTITGDIIAYTISATTYYNLPVDVDVYVTGGTYTNGTATFTNNTGGTFNVSNFFTGNTEVFVTGGTYNNTTGTATFINNTGGTFSVTGFSTGTTDSYTTGATLVGNTIQFGNNVYGPNLYNVELTDIRFSGGSAHCITDLYVTNFHGCSPITFHDNVILLSGLTVTNNTSTTISATTYLNLPTDIRVTGGTYSNATGTATYTNNTGGTFNVTGFFTGQSIFDVFVTGGTYSNTTGVATFRNNTGGTFSVINFFTGSTEVFVTGGSYNQSTGTATFTNNTGGTFSVSNFFTGNTEVFVTGGTLNGSTATFTNNTGGTFTVTGFTTPFTGGTVNGATIFTGGLSANTFSANTILTNTVSVSGSVLTKNHVVTEAMLLSTGAYSFSGLTLGTGNTFSVGQAKGYIIDSTDPTNVNPIFVSYSGQTGLTPFFLTSSTATYILVNTASTLTFTSTEPTPQQRRENIQLGVIGHPNSSVTGIGNRPDLNINSMSQIRDMFTPIRLINDGVVCTYNTGLTISNTAGTLYGLGLGYITNGASSPTTVTIAASTPTTFQYRTQTGGTFSNTTTISAGTYDVSGVSTTIPGTGSTATNQRIYLLENGNIRIQFGQTLYSTLTEAIASSESFVVAANNRTLGLLIGILSITRDCTTLSDSSKARFLQVSKFGESVGSAANQMTGYLLASLTCSANVDQVITTSASTIAFDTDEVSAFGGISRSGNTFIISSTGLYQFSLQPQVLFNNNGTVLSAWVQKNGVNIPRSGIRASAGNAADSGVLPLITTLDLVANDQITFKATSSVLVGATLDFTASGATIPAIPAVILDIKGWRK